MANDIRTEALTRLVSEAGSDRHAAQLIQMVKGCGPTHSAIYKARQGAGTDYVVQCYIDDITEGLRRQHETGNS